MSITDRTDSSQSEALAFEFDLPHAPAKVWRALTEPALLSEWLLPVINHKLEAGAQFTFTAPPQPGWDGIVNCQFIAIEHEKALSWTWVVGDIDTVVRFDLSPTETGTRVMLVQSGFKSDQKRNFGGARYGWNMMGGKLLQVLEALA
ncbi:MAG: SRPBCC domain-containing protein [Gemmatimonadaceae bacterium]|nr:SRPBCC domain-containing protein [Gemmatimonadaceae bacterium]